MLAGVAILLGTTAVTAMLALATTIGDRIHKELAVYGANIVVYPKADLLDVKMGGVDVKPATGGAYLKESGSREAEDDLLGEQYYGGESGALQNPSTSNQCMFDTQVPVQAVVTGYVVRS